jgi:hypothetical protein
MDDVNAAGLVPAALLRWELTGRMPDDVKRMLGPLSARRGPSAQ